MVGLGITGSTTQANDFLTVTGISSPPILLDHQYQVISHYGVSGTPTWILFDGNGNQLARGSRINQSLHDAVAAAVG